MPSPIQLGTEKELATVGVGREKERSPRRSGVLIEGSALSRKEGPYGSVTGSSQLQVVGWRLLHFKPSLSSLPRVDGMKAVLLASKIDSDQCQLEQFPMSNFQCVGSTKLVDSVQFRRAPFVDFQLWKSDPRIKNLRPIRMVGILSSSMMRRKCLIEKPASARRPNRRRCRNVEEHPVLGVVNSGCLFQHRVASFFLV